jgi:hypothetical protein
VACFLAFFAFLVLCGCSHHEGKPIKLPSGRIIRMIAMTRVQRPNGLPELLVDYQTDLKMFDQPINSWQDLSSEVDEVWSVVRPEAEKSHFTSVYMRAHEVPHGMFAKTSPTYPSAFLKGADGIWDRVVMK